MIYKCESCEKEFDEPIKIEETKKDNYDCLNGYLDKCCPCCKSASIYYRIDEMKKKIIKDLKGNCSHMSERGYDSWKTFLSDCNDMEEDYDEVLYEEFTENELEEMWQKSDNKDGKRR